MTCVEAFLVDEFDTDASKSEREPEHPIPSTKHQHTHNDNLPRQTSKIIHSASETQHTHKHIVHILFEPQKKLDRVASSILAFILTVSQVFLVADKRCRRRVPNGAANSPRECVPWRCWATHPDAILLRVHRNGARRKRNEALLRTTTPTASNDDTIERPCVYVFLCVCWVFHPHESIALDTVPSEHWTTANCCCNAGEPPPQSRGKQSSLNSLCTHSYMSPRIVWVNIVSSDHSRRRWTELRVRSRQHRLCTHTYMHIRCAFGKTSWEFSFARYAIFGRHVCGFHLQFGACCGNHNISRQRHYCAAALMLVIIMLWPRWEGSRRRRMLWKFDHRNEC